MTLIRFCPWLVPAPQTRAAAAAFHGGKPVVGATPACQERKRMFIWAIALIMQISPCWNYFKALKIPNGIFKRTSRGILSPQAHGTGSRSTSQPQTGTRHLCLPVPVHPLFPTGKETQAHRLERSCDTCIYIMFNIIVSLCLGKQRFTCSTTGKAHVHSE